MRAGQLSLFSQVLLLALGRCPRRTSHAGAGHAGSCRMHHRSQLCCRLDVVRGCVDVRGMVSVGPKIRHEAKVVMNVAVLAIADGW